MQFIKKWVSKFLSSSQRGAVNTGYIVAFIVAAIAILVVVQFISPVGETINALDTANVGTTTKTLLTNAPLIMGAGILVGAVVWFVRGGMGKGG